MRCVVIDDDSVTRCILSEYIERTDFLVDAGQYGNLVDAVHALQEDPLVDLIFLDVRFPQMTGFDFLESLDRPPQTVIMSVSDEYALRAFDIGATDYLLKPISYGRFFKSVSKALRWMRPISPDEVLYLKKNNALVRVPYQDILWIESMDNYVKVYTEQERFILHFTLKAIEGHLPTTVFRRIHRSYIINLSRIESIEDNMVILRGEGEAPVALPVGKVFRDNLLGSINFISLK